MANYENIKDKGFDKRTTSELREIASRGGKASGEARRKKADFRKTLNLLLTAKIDNPEWTPMLEALGLDSTLESAVNAAMIREALNGDVKAYEAIARYSGQSDRTEADHEEQRARMDKEQAQTKAIKKKSELGEADEIEDDGFMDALKGDATGDWEDEETDI